MTPRPFGHALAWPLLFFALVSAFGCAPRGGAPRAPDGKVLTDLDKLPDSDFESPEKRDVEEQENESDQEDIDSDVGAVPENPQLKDGDPLEYLPNQSISLEEGKIRAATWNLHLLTRRTAKRNVTGQVGGLVQDRIATLLKIVKDSQITIIALQEVYLITKYKKTQLAATPAPTPTATPPPFKIKTVASGKQTENDHPLFSGNFGDYKVVRGKPTKTIKPSWTTPDGRFRISLEMREYLPIMYNSKLLDCGGSQTDEIANARGLHRVNCKVLIGGNNAFDFTFASTHFSSKGTDIDGEVDGLIAFLPNGPKSGGIDPDFLIGGDFNSTPQGYKKQKWKLLSDNHGLVVNGDTKVQGGFSKYHLKVLPGPPPTVGFFLVKDLDKRILDDILIFLATYNEDYVKGSKRVLPIFGRFFTPNQAGLAGFLIMSDHLPVIADFYADRDTQ